MRQGKAGRDLLAIVTAYCVCGQQVSDAVEEFLGKPFEFRAGRKLLCDFTDALSEDVDSNLMNLLRWASTYVRIDWMLMPEVILFQRRAHRNGGINDGSDNDDDGTSYGDMLVALGKAHFLGAHDRAAASLRLARSRCSRHMPDLPPSAFFQKVQFLPSLFSRALAHRASATVAWILQRYGGSSVISVPALSLARTACDVDVPHSEWPFPACCAKARAKPCCIEFDEPLLIPMSFDRALDALFLAVGGEDRALAVALWPHVRDRTDWLETLTLTQHADLCSGMMKSTNMRWQHKEELGAALDKFLLGLDPSPDPSADPSPDPTPVTVARACVSSSSPSSSSSLHQ